MERYAIVSVEHASGGSPAVQRFCPACEKQVAGEGELCPICGTRVVRVIDQSLVGTEIDGKFVIQELLGKGGRGAVYLAQQRSMDRAVAIKVLRPEYAADPMSIARFYQEARAVSRLSHANCITVYDFGQTSQGLLYIVMEYLRGRSLTKVVQEEAPLPLRRTVHIAAQICDALAEAHEKGIVHRDLKLGNVVLVQQHGNADFVKVLDFGLAKVAHADGEKSLTTTGSVSGTPNYMSPEQVLGHPIDSRSDLYSLGVMLFEMLTRQRLFKADNESALMLKHVTEPVPRLDQVAPELAFPAAVDRLLARALAKQREERPASAAEFKEALRALVDPSRSQPTLPALPNQAALTSQPPLARTEPLLPATHPSVPTLDLSRLADGSDPVPPAAPAAGRRRWLLLWIGGAIAIALALALVAGFGLRSGGSPRTTSATSDAALPVIAPLPTPDAAQPATSPATRSALQPDASSTADGAAVPRKKKTIAPRNPADGKKRLLPIE